MGPDKELRAELKNPTPKAELTAAADPAALDGLIEDRSVFLSIYSQMLALIRDFRNPPVIETTAEPVEVAEIWTRRQLKVPAMVTLGGHLLAILLVFGGFSFGPAEVVRTPETFIPLYLPADLMMLPEEDDTSGLDENAVKALKEWTFRPGMRNGVPVDVALNIEINFNLR